MDRHKEFDKNRIDLSNRKERIDCSDPEGLVQRHFEESLRRANIHYTLQTGAGTGNKAQQNSPPAVHNQTLNQNPQPKAFSNYTITSQPGTNNINIVSKQPQSPVVPQKVTQQPVAQQKVNQHQLVQQQSVIVNHRLFQKQQQLLQQHQLQHKVRPKLQISRSWKGAATNEPEKPLQNAQMFVLPVPKPKISAPAPTVFYGQPTSAPTLPPVNDVTISRVQPNATYQKPEISITPTQKEVSITPGPPPAHYSMYSKGLSPPIDEQPLNLGVKRQPQASEPIELKKMRLPVPYKDEFVKPKVIESEKLRNTAAESLLSFNQHAVHFTPQKPAPLVQSSSNGKEIIQNSSSPNHSPTPKHMKKAWIQRSTGNYEPFPAPQNPVKLQYRHNFNFDPKSMNNYSSETDSATEGEDTPNEDGSISDSSDMNLKKKVPTKPRNKKPIIRRTQEEREMIARYKKTGESFLQYRPCFEIQRIQKCRECRWVSAQGTSGICCRFYHFRRLKFINNGHDLVPDGFSDPTNDPNSDDLNVWMPDPENPPTSMDIRTSIYLLRKVGDQFCEVWKADHQAVDDNISVEPSIAWKKIVADIREMCDVCATTIFNYHWTCGNCGFTVCPDCYRDRKALVANAWSKNKKERDEYSWLLCHKREPHKIESLILTQIVAGKSLDILERQIHSVRHIWQIPQFCNCELSQQMISGGDSIYKEIARTLLQEELDSNADGLDLEALLENNKEDLKEEPPAPPPIESKKKLARTTEKYPNTPHSWLCDGRLLLLEDLNCKTNIKLFQSQWRRGQPVMVSKISSHLNMDLWLPESFCRDFGSQTNDLVNCINGKIVTGRTMKEFWDGFECIEKRLMDGKDRPMLLKLKDWPAGDDFAEILPERYQDLMKSLPMGEYTFRTGQLNLASRLPKYFVPPDLGPKMYNAYGSALHADKGTTNLHLDVSDAVNVMVYVGISKDEGKSREYIQKAYQAIDDGGCDILMRARVREKDKVPGALWHIYSPKDVPKIREFLNGLTVKKGGKIHDNHDPIHDQTQYLDRKLRLELKKKYNVVGYAIAQCLGDAVFIPAGAPHQVRNLHNCIKVAEDFVSPENIVHCFKLTNEFRNLSESHSNHEDKLQIKNIIYHTVKDAAAYLNFVLNQRITRGGIPASTAATISQAIPEAPRVFPKIEDNKPQQPQLQQPSSIVNDFIKKEECDIVDVMNFENSEKISSVVAIDNPRNSSEEDSTVSMVEIKVDTNGNGGDGGDGVSGCYISTIDSSNF